MKNVPSIVRAHTISNNIYKKKKQEDKQIYRERVDQDVDE